MRTKGGERREEEREGRERRRGRERKGGRKKEYTLLSAPPERDARGTRGGERRWMDMDG
jgi:hypothetical protein